ncbi:cell wall-binding repeat-containing protein [Romboutsia hominis]|uniref:Cell surface protein n=1 Tax=Romboutsia hominis TaxID=1507512 RepID=A0A2P2BRE8_9FIRM|nr:cell wall-binding repeat-containing protein [Romboutsia hominis]CEI72917.1 Cell surface protein [Romboutsia hominis]
MKISKKLLALGVSFSIAISNVSGVHALSSIEEIKGRDRYETAGMIADKQDYNTAIVVNSHKSLADGLSASGLAGVVNAPILLATDNEIPYETDSRLIKVDKIYVVGGENAVTPNIEHYYRRFGIEVERLSGNDRIETSYAVAEEVKEQLELQGKKIDKIFLTNGYKGEPDAMSIAPVSARDNAPIILTNGQSIPFNAKDIDSYVIGGKTNMSDNLVQDTKSERLGGTDRFDTNKKIINKFYPGSKEFHITKAYNLVDALTGSTIAKNTPIVLVHNNSDKSILKGATKVTALGGIDESIIQECINAVNGVVLSGNIEVHFINVGQGDATYIEMPDGTDILIDAGESKYGSTVVNYLNSQEKGMDLDYLISTHPDADHVGGMQEVFKQLNVKNFYYPADAPHNTQTWKNVLSLANTEGCKILDSKPGTIISGGGATLKFIHPTKDYNDNNEDSVVGLLDYNNTEVLLTGDAEAITEQDMVSQNLVPDVDVLKVGHHGSNTSTTQEFLNKAKPEHAVISVGENSYGHPTQNILNRLFGIGSKVWRTDKNGHVIMTSDGNNIDMKSITGGPQTKPDPEPTPPPTVDKIVYANGGSSSSNKYHKTATSHGMKGAIKMTESEAKKKGYIACKTCF